MAHVNTRKPVRTGIVSPVTFQVSIVYNAHSAPALIRRRNAQNDMRAQMNKKPGPYNCSIQPGDLSLHKYDLAFHDVDSTGGLGNGPVTQYMSRTTLLNQTDLRLWSSWNNYQYDPKREPKCIGVMDTSEDMEEASNPMQRPGSVVAVHGTRSLANNSYSYHHAGDPLGWLPPATKVTPSGSHIPNRPHIDGVPDTKMLPQTVPFTLHEYGSVAALWNMVHYLDAKDSGDGGDAPCLGYELKRLKFLFNKDATVKDALQGSGMDNLPADNNFKDYSPLLHRIMLAKLKQQTAALDVSHLFKSHDHGKEEVTFLEKILDEGNKELRASVIYGLLLGLYYGDLHQQWYENHRLGTDMRNGAPAGQLDAFLHK